MSILVTITGAPFNDQQRKLLEEHFGRQVAGDTHNAFFDRVPVVRQTVIRKVLHAGRSPITVAFHGPGDDIVQLANGDSYVVDTRGNWRKAGTGERP